MGVFKGLQAGSQSVVFARFFSELHKDPILLPIEQLYEALSQTIAK